MSSATFAPGPLQGAVKVPGDKSISHRALMLAAATIGTTRIVGVNRGEDVTATQDAVCALGAAVEEHGDELTVAGGSLHDPATDIHARNSGTTARLLMGLCAGHGIVARFDGDASLRRRPMERVAALLRRFGATVETTAGHLPALVRGVEQPQGGAFALEAPSAQLKSAALLAALRSPQDVRITGDARSRDHTERMLRLFGRDIAFDGFEVTLRPGTLRPAEIHVPGDLSAAAFFLVGAVLAPGSDVLVEGAGVNPTRTGVLDVLQMMGANIALHHRRDQSGEPVADVRASSSALRGVEVSADLVVRAVDEIPVLAVAAAFAEGTTRIHGTDELRTKESDRVAAIAGMLHACGIATHEHGDVLEIAGGRPRRPTSRLRTYGDHRMAMAAAVLGAVVGPVDADDGTCVDVSFPDFGATWRGCQELEAHR